MNLIEYITPDVPFALYNNQWRPNSKSSFKTCHCLLGLEFGVGWIDWLLLRHVKQRPGLVDSKNVNNPINKAPRNSSKKSLRNRKLSYGLMGIKLQRPIQKPHGDLVFRLCEVGK